MDYGEGGLRVALIFYNLPFSLTRGRTFLLPCVTNSVWSEILESLNLAHASSDLTVKPRRLVCLFCLFFLIALGLGYPILNRYDPRQTPGLIDVRSYAAIVTNGSSSGPPHMRFRVLVPWIAKPVYHLLRGRVGSWDPVMAAFLATDSVFVAMTALLIILLGLHVFGDFPTSLVAALLYLLNFAVPNLRLAGLVDAGEGFFLLAILWSLSQSEYRFLPVIAILGALTKETFVPLSIIFMAAWWSAAYKQRESRPASTAWIAWSGVLSIAAILGLHWKLEGSLLNPLTFAESFHQNRQYLSQLATSLWDRNMLYIFVWLLPVAMPRLRKFPKTWLFPTAAAGLMIFVLDSYYGGAPGTVARELFSVAGPILALSAASLLCNREPIPPERN